MEGQGPRASCHGKLGKPEKMGVLGDRGSFEDMGYQESQMST